MTKDKQHGFTILEMSMVLVLIGMILGMVSLGKDLHRNAAYAKVYSNFIQQWALAYNNYLSRTGVVPGDNQAVPTLKVNGNTTLLCEPAATGAPTSGLFSLMHTAGVQMPQGRAAGSENHFVYLDSNGIAQDISICFQNITWLEPNATGGFVNRNRNVMLISGLTPDLARSLDAVIDGQADARFGSFRQSPALTNPASQAWSTNNTQALGGGTAFDEGQIITTSAIYRMLR